MAEAMGEIEITVVSAAGLRNADLFGKSDPYCVCEVAGKRILTTEVKSNTLDPVWNQSVKIAACSGPLVFSVYDKDLGSKDDLLGTATVPIQSFEGFVPLQKAGNTEGKKAAVLRLKIAGNGLPVERKSSIGAERSRLRHVEGPSRTESRKSSIETVRLRKVEGEVTPATETHCDLNAVRARLRHVEGQSRAESRKNSIEAVRLKHVEGQSRMQSRTSSVEKVELKRVETRTRVESRASSVEKVELRHVETRLRSQFKPSSLEVVNLRHVEGKSCQGAQVEEDYDEESAVDITVVGARGLRDADLMGKSDPYCVCEIGGKRVLQTDVVKDTLDPEWNRSIRVASYDAKAPLVFSIYDKDLGSKDDLLGTVTVQSASFMNDGLDQEVVLEQTGKKGGQVVLLLRIVPVFLYATEISRQITVVEESRGGSQDDAADASRRNAGPLTRPDQSRRSAVEEEGEEEEGQQTLGGFSDISCTQEEPERESASYHAAHDTEHGSACLLGRQQSLCASEEVPLEITVVGAEGLHGANSVGGKSDPFCVCEVGGREVLRTEVVKDLNPVWNKSVCIDDACKEPLLFSVYDKDLGSKAFLGSVSLPSSSFLPNGFEGKVPLEKGGKGVQAFLILKVVTKGHLLHGAYMQRESVTEQREIHFLHGAHKQRESLTEQKEVTTVTKLKRDLGFLKGSYVPKEQAAVGGLQGDVEFLRGHETQQRASMVGRIRSDSAFLQSSEATNGAESVSRLHTGQAGHYSEHPLDITIRGAKSLRDADIIGKSDPFCVCEIDGKEVLRTKVVQDSVNPSWNESVRVLVYRTYQIISLKIYDKDTMSADDLLGTVTVDGESLAAGLEGDFPLEGGKGTNGSLSLKIAPVHTELPLDVTVVGAKGLRNADMMDKSDPFCVCKVAGKEVLKTGVVQNNLNPVWNESVHLASHKMEEPLVFCVYDKDTWTKSDLLGTVTVPGDSFWSSRGFEGDVPLDDAGKGTKSFITLRIAPQYPTEEASRRTVIEAEQARPSAEESRCSLAQASRAEESRRSTAEELTREVPLDVTIVGARGLRDADMIGKSDPFCVCEVDGKPVLKTATVSDNLNPVWNQTVRVVIYSIRQLVVFSVYDKDSGSSADLLGTVTLDSQRCCQGFEGDARLEKAGKGAEAFLTLKIAPAKADQEQSRRSVQDEDSCRSSKRSMLEMHEDAECRQSVPASQPGQGEEVPLDITVPRVTVDGAKSDDQFCVCQVAGKEVLRTKVDPTSNQTIRITIYRYIQTVVVFLIYDKETCSPDNLLGKVHLDSRDLEGGFAGDIPLEIEGKSTKAFLSLNVLPASTTAGSQEQPVDSRCSKASLDDSRRSFLDASRGSTYALRELPLDVTVVGAKGLRNADMLGKSDPFCICYVAGKEVLKTAVVQNNLNPLWNQSVHLASHRVEEPLVFCVYDKDTLSKSEVLGTVKLPCETFWRGGFEGDVPLDSAGKGTKSYLTLKIAPTHAEESRRSAVESRQSHGAGFEAQRSSPRQAEELLLDVTVVGAKGLPNADGLDKSDPFCTCEIAGQEVLRTSAIANNLNPTWNEGVRVAGYRMQELLIFYIYDKDTWTRSDLLGTVRVRSESFVNGCFEGYVPLDTAGKSEGAFLTLRILMHRASQLESVQLRHAETRQLEVKRSSLTVVKLRHVETRSNAGSRTSSLEKVNLRHVEVPVETVRREPMAVGRLQGADGFLRDGYAQKDLNDVGKLQRDMQFLQGSPEKTRASRSVGRLQFTPPQQKEVPAAKPPPPRTSSRVRNMVNDIEHHAGSAPNSRPSSKGAVERKSQLPPTPPKHAFHVVGPGPATMKDIEDSPQASSSGEVGRTFI